MRHSQAPSQLRGELLLLAITAIWGTTFIVMEQLLSVWPPFAIMTLRFGLALPVLLPFVQWRALSWPLVQAGGWLGILAFIGFALQTVALHYTSVAHAAFGSSLTTLFVPLLGLLRGKRPPLGTGLAVILALLGSATLFDWHWQDPTNLGDLLAIAAAVAFSGQIILLGSYSARFDMGALVGVELTASFLLSLLTTLSFEGSWPSLILVDSLKFVYLGALCTAICLLGQAFGQRGTNAARTAYIFALEPVFATAFAWFWPAQRLTGSELWGACALLLAALCAERHIALPRWQRLRAWRSAAGRRSLGRNATAPRKIP